MNNSNKLFYYPDDLVSLRKQMEIALEPAIKQQEIINQAIQSVKLLNKPLINNLTKLRETINAYHSNQFKIANQGLKNINFTKFFKSQQTLISDALTLNCEFSILREAFIISKPYLTEELQEEIELGFEEHFKQNNEILNNPFLDKEIIKNILLNRTVCFFITVFSIITPLITDKATYQVVSNAIAYIYSELVRKYNIDNWDM